jgi:hypothetical protein
MVNTWMPRSAADDGERLMSAMCTLGKLTFRRQELPAVRHFGRAFGIRAGLGSDRRADLVLAVSEAAACALCHGPCAARMRLWTMGTRVFCEVRSDGLLLGQGPGAVEQGDVEGVRRRLLQLICDHVSIERGPYGVTVCFSMSVA